MLILTVQFQQCTDHRQKSLPTVAKSIIIFGMEELTLAKPSCLLLLPLVLAGRKLLDITKDRSLFVLAQMAMAEFYFRQFISVRYGVNSVAWSTADIHTFTEQERKVVQGAPPSPPPFI